MARDAEHRIHRQRSTGKIDWQLAVEVEKAGNRVCGTSIMGLMMLGAAKGDSIVVHVDGANAEQELERLVHLVESGFGEEGA